MKKFTVLFLSMLMLLSFAACGSTSNTSGTQGTADQGSSSVSGTDALSSDEMEQIGNPFVDCETMEEAEEIAGFEMKAPDILEGYSNSVIQAVENTMIQVFYCYDPENIQESDYTLFRKGAGEEDISGDYSEYAYEKEIQVDDLTVTMKGFESNNLAVWNDGVYSYSIYSCEELSDETMAELVRSVK